MDSFRIVFIALICLFLLFGSVNAAIVINEFELNPIGDDEDIEWIEIYNTGEFEENISGWMLIESDNMKEMIIPSNVLILGNGYYVINWTNGTLINSRALNITLYESDGAFVDRTITEEDNDNNGKTWQRYSNGNDTDSDGDWQFRDGTMGETNGGSGGGEIPEFPAFIFPVLLMFASLSFARKYAPLRF